MREEATREEMNLEFYGKPPKVTARFFTEQTTDIPASKLAGKRVMKDITMVELKCKRENAQIIKVATKEDMGMYRKSYMAYLEEQENAKDTGTAQDVYSAESEDHRRAIASFGEYKHG